MKAFYRNVFSIIGEFDKLNNSDQSIILGRTSYDVDEFFRTRGVHDGEHSSLGLGRK